MLGRLSSACSAWPLRGVTRQALPCLQQRRLIGSGMPPIFREKKVGDLERLRGQLSKIGQWTIEEGATVFEATKKMVEQNIGCLCVLRDDKIVGVVTERDYLTKVMHCGKTSDKTAVSEIATMEDKLVLACPDDCIQDCVDVMASRNFRHLPIVERDGALIGLLSIRDITRELAEDRLARLYAEKDKGMPPVHDG